MAVAHQIESSLKTFESLLENARHKKRSLTGRGFYAKKARDFGAALRRDISSVAAVLHERARSDLAEDIRGYSDLLTKPTLSIDEKLELLDELVVRWQADFRPILEREAVPPSEEYVPAEFFSNLANPFRTVLSEVNACWLSKYWNAALVLVRRLAETLIIEWYEVAGKAGEITDGQGLYLRFGDLVGKVKSGQGLNLSVTARRALDKMKILADSAAHNRYFVAREGDLNGMRTELRVFFEELIGKLESLKKT